jgi:PAB-dependent poly(A)-specific ribonuclease subunit 2
MRVSINSNGARFYNKTEYSGLETHISNSYANPLLQLYRFTSVLRNLSLFHTAMACIRGDCMLCELGFLIDMLEKAGGQNCQASNFLKTFSGLPAGRIAFKYSLSLLII